MTTAEVWPEEEVEAPPAPVTPWSNRPDNPRTRPGPTTSAPQGVPSPGPAQANAPGQPGQSSSAAQPGQPGQPSQAGAAGPPSVSGPAGQPAQPGQVVPGQPVPGQSGEGVPGGVVAPQSQQVGAGGAGREAEVEPEPLVDPELVAGVLPMAGMMAMGMLPLIASALSGLGGGGNGGGAAPVAAGSGGGGEASAGGGLSPEAARALEVLRQLERVYGEADPSDPKVRELQQQLGISPGKGAGARSIRAKQLFQRNAAKAFNNVDNQLVSYVRGLAGSNKVDKKAIVGLVREVNVALAELGPQAYTKAGQQKVHQILTAALQKAHAIVSGGQAKSSDIAGAINRLTKQYLYNIAGKNYTPPTTGGAGAGATGAAAKAIQVALAQLGDPYVWGAEGPNAFDCSGLMQYAAAAAGVRIPRVAADQYRTLPKVNPRDIKPGDLIFPSSSFKGANNPGHVIMYIGNGMCVEAPRTGGHVQYRKLPDSYAAARWA